MFPIQRAPSRKVYGEFYGQRRRTSLLARMRKATMPSTRACTAPSTSDAVIFEPIAAERVLVSGSTDFGAVLARSAAGVPPSVRHPHRPELLNANIPMSAGILTREAIIVQRPLSGRSGPLRGPASETHPPVPARIEVSRPPKRIRLGERYRWVKRGPH